MRRNATIGLDPFIVDILVLIVVVVVVVAIVVGSTWLQSGRKNTISTLFRESKGYGAWN